MRGVKYTFGELDGESMFPKVLEHSSSMFMVEGNVVFHVDI